VAANRIGCPHRWFALHNLKRTQEALVNLLPAADICTDGWNLPFNLACYYTQLDRLEDLKEWCEKVTAIDEPAVKRAAIQGPDLKPLWDSMSGTLWRWE
jgi:hypothetical protein